MKILQVHKFLYRKAGAETYLFDLTELLRTHGHEVMLWGPENPLNFDKREGIIKDLKKFGQMIWSFEAARKFEKVLKAYRPDVIHIHNIYHHISPSILPIAKKYGVPVVATVHDYHLINPNYSLYDHGAICERQAISAILHRCIKNSFAASFADVVEFQAHRFLRVYEKNVAKFIAPTEFVKDKLVEGGMDDAKIEVMPLPIAPPPQSSPTRGEEVKGDSPPLMGGVRGGWLGRNYILFAGRLVEEKGIYLLLEIAKRLPEIKFKIAGTGPEEKNLALQVKRHKLQNVELLGFVDKKKLQPLIAGARLVLVPSLWYEPSPFAVLEAMAAGKVVVASRLGGIQNLIKDGKTGFLMEPDNVSQWVDRIAKVCYDEVLLKKVGTAAQSYIKKAHDPEKHYEKIMEIYRATDS